MQKSNPTPDAPKRADLEISPFFSRVLLPIMVILVGWLGYSILSVPPEKPKRPRGKNRVLKTKVDKLYIQDYATKVRTQGVIRPHNEVTLTAQVSGKINHVTPSFEDGGFFAKDDILIELDDSDFQTALIVAKANLARALTTFAQEQTRAKQAQLNWDDLGYDEEPNELVLRLPQMREAEATVNSAQAQVERAQRDLDRCKIRAPFDGRVRERLVGLGQTIGGSTPLASVFAVDYAEVRLPIAGRDMSFLTLPEGPEQASVRVELRDVLNEDNSARWAADIVRTEGALDENSLELFAIARVQDPFGRNSGGFPLRIGQPVVGIIPGTTLSNVFVVPRLAVRQLDKIMLIDEDTMTLSRRTIEPVWSDEDHLIIEDDTIPDGVLIATTSLVYAPDGAKVEILPNVPTTSDDANQLALNAKDGKPQKPSQFKKLK